MGEILGALMILFLGIGFGGGFAILVFNNSVGSAIMIYSLFLATITFVVAVIYFLIKGL